MTGVVIGFIVVGVVVLVVLAVLSPAVLREYERGWSSGWGMCARSTNLDFGFLFRWRTK
ncbi:hypothetical protein I547_0702 [Mycobacterium kansasii 824]|nr:hypothetical protein I547_0702 [Mycobacterium kansasii 824]